MLRRIWENARTIFGRAETFCRIIRSTQKGWLEVVFHLQPDAVRHRFHLLGTRTIGAQSIFLLSWLLTAERRRQDFRTSAFVLYPVSPP